MKKLFVLILALVLCCSSAFAGSIDLSGMTFDELVALREQLNLAIWNSQEWQEVTVPEGTYQIGVDIPAGHWSIKEVNDLYLHVFYFDILNEDTRSLGRGSQYYDTYLQRSGVDAFGYPVLSETDIDMKDGWYFECSGPVVFTPYTGKPDLGFK